MKTKQLRLLTLTLILTACATPVTSQPTLPSASSVPPTATSARSATASLEPTLTSTPMPFELTSPAFESEGVIPDRFSCKGEDISPELVWGNPPAGTQSFAIVFDDPDAGGGGWVHWVIFNIPANARGLPKAVQADETLADGSVNGENSWGAPGYRGPCPPQGSTHRYVFRLYALDAGLSLDAGASKRGLLAAMEGHILAEVELAASFKR